MVRGLARGDVRMILKMTATVEIVPINVINCPVEELVIIMPINCKLILF